MEEITDEELDKMIAEKEAEKTEKTEKTQEVVVAQPNFVQPKFEQTQFAKNMEEVKLNVLKEASVEDTKFVETIKKNLKEAATTNTEVEKEKANLEKEQVKSEGKKIEKEQVKTSNEIAEEKWNNRQKWRQFIYDGVKPIMTFVGITDPMNCFLTIFFTVILIIPFFVAKLWNATIGALLLGACDKDRSNSIKGLFWTILVVMLLCLLLAAGYLFLKSQGIDLLSRFK